MKRPHSLAAEKLAHPHSYGYDWKAEGLRDGIYYYVFTLETCTPQKGWVEVLK
jgi:hypothetical protein